MSAARAVFGWNTVQPWVFSNESTRTFAATSLIAPGGQVLCLVSGGADSTCLFHALSELGYRVSALHVNYCLRGRRVRRGCAVLRRGARRDRCADRGARRERGGAAGDPLRPAARLLARDRPHGKRPGRDDHLPARDEREPQGDQAASRGRRRASAAAALARGDGSVLPSSASFRSEATRRTRVRSAV